MEHFSTIRNLRNRSVLFLKFKLNKSFDIFLHFYIETIVFLMNLKNFQHHCARFWPVLKDPARWLSNRAMKIPPVSMVNRGFAKNFCNKRKREIETEWILLSFVIILPLFFHFPEIFRETLRKINDEISFKYNIWTTPSEKTKKIKIYLTNNF